jgi:hypothetical protein
MRATTLLTFFLFCGIVSISAQEDDLLSLLGDEEETTYATASFKANRVINLHSLENSAAGVMDIKIGHRFGFINQGAYELFGLDNATIRIGADVGLTDHLMIGVGRSSFEKTYDGFAKLKLLRQWNVLASRRGNRAADSSELLAPIHRSMVILENQSYLELCLLLKGESTPDSVLLGIESGSTEFATRAYGVACWHRLRGEESAAQGLLLRIIAEGPANSFGCIAAEADVLRSAKR